MRKRMTACAVAILAVALGWSGCRKQADPMEVGKEIPPPSGDTNFTPPEIRRPAPSADTAQTKSVQKDTVAAASSKPARDTQVHPAPAVPAAKPVPAPASLVAKPAATPAATTTGPGDPGPDGDWVLQVNVYPSEAAAKAEVDRLASQGIPAYFLPVPNANAGLSGNYWRLRVGRFKSRAQAQAYGDKRIAAFSPKFWIDKKSNESRQSGTP